MVSSIRIGIPHAAPSVVISRHQEVNPCPGDAVNHPVSLGDPPRPASRQAVLERLRLSDPLKGIADAKRDAPFGCHPKPEILQELALKDRLAFSGRPQATSPGASAPRSLPGPGFAPPGSEPLSDASHRS